MVPAPYDKNDESYHVCRLQRFQKFQATSKLVPSTTACSTIVQASTIPTITSMSSSWLAVLQWLVYWVAKTVMMKHRAHCHCLFSSNFATYNRWYIYIYTYQWFVIICHPSSIIRRSSSTISYDQLSMPRPFSASAIYIYYHFKYQYLSIYIYICI